jgi:Xaa-Pro aminopeptidase
MAPLSDTDRKLRRARLISLLGEQKLDVLLVTSLPNVRYLTGFTGSNAALVVSGDRSVLFTDPRYRIQASEETGYPVRVAKGPLITAVAGFLKNARWRAIGFERAHTNYDAWTILDEAFPSGARLKPTATLIERLRMVKSDEEIALIRQSMDATVRAFEQVIHRVRPGRTELEIAAELDYRMRKSGAEQPAFETIVASGPRSALPHARPTNRRLAEGDLLLADMGAFREGYASDMTRVAFLGKPPARVKQMYNAVLLAQLAALEAVREGVAAQSVDRAARQVLRNFKLDRQFVHSTGHGLGLEIHEAPRLGKRDRTVLQAGMAVTIEPGVYLQGFGGIRIEDTVAVTRTGCEVLTRAPKELLML